MDTQPIEEVIEWGIYCIGDPKSCLSEIHWNALLNEMQKSKGPKYSVGSYTVIAFQVMSGEPWDEDDNHYAVESGYFAAVPKRLVLDCDPDKSRWVKFKAHCICSLAWPTLKFGQVTINFR